MPEAQPQSTTTWLVEQYLIDQLRRHGPQRRGDLAASTGLARTTIVNALQTLMHRGVVAELADNTDRVRSVGRPAALIALTTRDDVVVLELGRRTSTLSTRASGELQHAVLPLTFRSDLDEICGTVGSQLAGQGFDRGRTPACTVVSIPLPLRGDRGAQPVFMPWTGLSNSVKSFESVPDWLIDDPAADLRERLDCPVLIENDGNLAAYGEAHAGAGRGHAAILHLSIKEGLGSGLVFDGSLFRGATGIAGELAHVSVQDDGAQCICGNRGCLMTIESGPFLVDKIEALYGQPLEASDLEFLAAKQDPAFLRILNDLGRGIGKPLAPVAALLNLDIVIVDARLGGAGLPLARGLQEALAHRVTPIAYRALQVVTGTCGETAIAAGGLALGRDFLLRTPTGS